MAKGVDTTTKRRRTVPRVLADDEAGRLLSLIPTRYRCPHRTRIMVLMALAVGLRIGELRGLRVRDLDRNSGRLHVRGKGGHERVLYLPAEVLEEVTRIIERWGSGSSDLIFATLRGGALDPGYCRRRIAAYGQRAGIHRLHWHLLRHTALSRLYTECTNLEIVRAIAGHANLSTTSIYLHTSPRAVQDVLTATHLPTCAE